jgi:hypothetical protein
LDATITPPVQIQNGVSPKVAVPGYIGLIATVITCTLHNKGINMDPGTVVGIVVTVMGFAGYVTKHLQPPPPPKGA